jgi:hypothetical protein
MKLSRAAALIAALSLGACAHLPTYSMVDGGISTAVGDGVSVNPQTTWSKTPFPSYYPGAIWTIDGEALDQIIFMTGIEPGKPLLTPVVAQKLLPKTYQSSMVPDDVMELLGATLVKVGEQQMRTFNLRPAPFGAAGGFRFDVSYTTRGGLEMKGKVLAAQRGGKLDMILFIAPAEYYYGRYETTVDRLFDSVQASAN